MNNIPVEKNKEYEVEIIDNGYEGEGIAKIDDFTIFINGAIKGEICKILIVKINKSFAFGKLIEVLKPSKNRTIPDCSTYKRCGGCNLRHIKYEETLRLKKEMIQNLVNKSLNKKIDINNVIGMEKPYYYRNKLQYPVGKNKDGIPTEKLNENSDLIHTGLKDTLPVIVPSLIYQLGDELEFDYDASDKRTREQAR